MGAFNELLRKEATTYDRRSVLVQLGGTDVTLYAAPLTGHDLDALMRRHPKFGEAPTLSAVCDLLIAKCETEAGDKAFDAADKPFLLKVGLGKINHIRATLFPDQDADLSDDAIRDEMGN